jgi:hypothetical protein
MVEEQALCRVHRVGQKRNVTTIRYLMRDSFEEVKCLTPISCSRPNHSIANCGVAEEEETACASYIFSGSTDGRWDRDGHVTGMLLVGLFFDSV